MKISTDYQQDCPRHIFDNGDSWHRATEHYDRCKNCGLPFSAWERIMQEFNEWLNKIFRKF